ncbi:MAG: Crp/Fnr family transcriptional regulator [Treponema sp.]|nr:Crp/Fnr family transcriptional regulator [Spirochaetia bacterium]MDD7274393.1 Crp/Fnr family transcriptional regulator [Treponema sp.]MDY3754524.1 Crp/Fnr family transcriptional regulator [Treponema sp.]MDY4674345.1 Crp/Fnr family transcriptional regulator [Treponema sp.]
MPKKIAFAKGSIIYFEEDKDDRIFILQKGLVVLSSTDVETGAPVTEYAREGEFFGVKSAFGRFPREETATVVADSLVIAMSVAEFEQLFSSNKQIIMKMLRVFSNQLRAVHKKSEQILGSGEGVNPQAGMASVAQCFYDEEQYRSCCDICLKFLKLYPNSDDKDTIARLYADSKKRLDMLQAKAARQDSGDQIVTPTGSSGFYLPGFERFVKTFERDSVIISEHEPGETFYLIQSGSIQLVKCVNGVRKNLDILHPGEFFGEMAILENSPRSATCVAIDKVEVLEFNKANFEVLITGNPQMALILLKLFCKRIYDQKRRLKILLIAEPHARLASVFMMFDEMNPSTNAVDKSRRFNLTISDLSHWSGLPGDVVRDEVNKFVEKRRIEVFDTYIIVKNIVDMKRVAK